MGFWYCETCQKQGNCKTSNDLRECRHCGQWPKYFENVTGPTASIGQSRRRSMSPLRDNQNRDRNRTRTRRHHTPPTSLPIRRVTNSIENNVPLNAGGRRSHESRNSIRAPDSTGGYPITTSSTNRQTPSTQSVVKRESDEGAMHSTNSQPMGSLVTDDRGKWCFFHHANHESLDCPVHWCTEITEFLTSAKIRWQSVPDTGRLGQIDSELDSDLDLELDSEPRNMVEMFNILYRLNQSLVASYPVFCKNRDHIFHEIDRWFGEQSGEQHGDIWMIWSKLVSQANQLTYDTVRSCNDAVYDAMQDIGEYVREHCGLGSDGEYGPLDKPSTYEWEYGLLFDLILSCNPAQLASIEEKLVKIVERYNRSTGELSLKMYQYLCGLPGLNRSPESRLYKSVFEYVLQAQVGFTDRIKGVGLQILEWPELVFSLETIDVDPLPFPQANSRRYVYSPANTESPVMIDKATQTSLEPLAAPAILLEDNVAKEVIEVEDSAIPHVKVEENT